MSTFPDSFGDTPGKRRHRRNEPEKVLKVSPAPPLLDAVLTSR